MNRDELLGKLLTWAETHYPAQARLPPAQRRPTPPWREFRLGREELIVLFAGTQTVRAHLALVDQPYVRARLVDPAIATAMHRSWLAKGGEARPLPQIIRRLQPHRSPQAAQTRLPL
jgi:hypothetical protein